MWVDGSQKNAESQEAEVVKGRENKKQANWSVVKEISNGENEKINVIVEVNTNELWLKGIIMPKGRIKLYWDGIIVALIVYSAVTVPCQLAFDSYTAGDGGTDNTPTLSLGLLFLDYIIIVFFFFDILASINTAYYSEKYDAYVTIRRLIFDQYLKSWLIVDFLAFVPFDIIVTLMIKGSKNTDLSTVQLIKVMRLLRLLKLMKLSPLSSHITYIEEFFNVSHVILSVLFTVFKLLIMGHFLACVWWGASSQLSDLPWYDSAQHQYTLLSHAPFRDQYVTSLYFAMTTLTTTGYGDITPVNSPERGLAIFMFIIGALVFGYVTANVAVIIGHYSHLEARSNKYTNQIKEYLRCEEMSNKFLAEVVNQAKNSMRRSSVFDEQKIMGRLPFHLRMGKYK